MDHGKEKKGYFATAVTARKGEKREHMFNKNCGFLRSLERKKMIIKPRYNSTHSSMLFIVLQFFNYIFYSVKMVVERNNFCSLPAISQPSISNLRGIYKTLR